MTTQPEALRMAQELDRRGLLEEAAELRRLHEVEKQRDELLAALRLFVDCALPVQGAGNHWTEGWLDQALPIARAAVAKAEGV